MNVGRPKLNGLGTAAGSLAALAAHYALDVSTAARVLELAAGEALSAVFGFEVDACLSPEGEFTLTGYLRDPYGGIAEIRDIAPGSVSRNVCNLVNSRLHAALESASARVRACGLAPIAGAALPGRIVSAPVPGEPLQVELYREVQGWWGAPVRGLCDWRSTAPHERGAYAVGQDRWWYVSAVYTARAGRLRRLCVKLSRSTARLPEALLRARLREEGALPVAAACVSRTAGRSSAIVVARPVPREALAWVSRELGEALEVRVARPAPARAHHGEEGHVRLAEARV